MATWADETATQRADHEYWVECGYDCDGTLLFKMEWGPREHTAEWRLVGHITMANYTITYTDRNTIKMHRLDPEAACQTLVMKRKRPYPVEGQDSTVREWPEG